MSCGMHGFCGSASRDVKRAGNRRRAVTQGKKAEPYGLPGGQARKLWCNMQSATCLPGPAAVAGEVVSLCWQLPPRVMIIPEGSQRDHLYSWLRQCRAPV